MLNIGWFSTARGESSRKLLLTAVESIKSGELNARISFVFCSREPGESGQTDLFFDLVKSYSLPLICCSVKKFANACQQKIGNKDGKLPQWRLDYDRKIMSLIKGFKVDIGVLAGYMLIVGNEMCNKYNMINLHPALPTGPKGTWQEVIWQLMGEKAGESGVMMHLVTPDLDRGPVITYCRYAITGPQFNGLWEAIDNTPISQIKNEQGEENELFKRIRQTGFIRETPLIIHTLRSFAESKIKIDRNKRLIDHLGQNISGYDLTREIDKTLAKATY
ncbi:MAG: formyltransferase family protein [Chloroflexi bacterium]|nr:formyltransferase family protein [Chloroflexota bacterium]